MRRDCIAKITHETFVIGHLSSVMGPRSFSFALCEPLACAVLIEAMANDKWQMIIDEFFAQRGRAAAKQGKAHRRGAEDAEIAEQTLFLCDLRDSAVAVFLARLAQILRVRV